MPALTEGASAGCHFTPPRVLRPCLGVSAPGPTSVLSAGPEPPCCSSTAGPEVSSAGELCPLVAAHTPPAGSGWPSCPHQRGKGPQRSEGGSESSTCKAFSLPRPLFSEGPFFKVGVENLRAQVPGAGPWERLELQVRAREVVLAPAGPALGRREPLRPLGEGSWCQAWALLLGDRQPWRHSVETKEP